MKKFILSVFIMANAFFAIAQTASYIGTLGKYKIIMELNTDDGESYTGRYHYDGKDQWIAVEGKTKDLVLYLKEYVNGKNTGMIDLVFEEKVASGNWRKTANDKPLKINLTYMEDGVGIIAADPIPNNMTGHYEMRGKVDNTNFPKDHKDEVPFGELSIEQLSDREISFELQYTSGYPEYHQALMNEKAVSYDGGKTYEFLNYISGMGADEKCKVNFTVKGKDLYLTGGTGIECGSGGNANPEGLYKKVK